MKNFVAILTLCTFLGLSATFLGPVPAVAASEASPIKSIHSSQSDSNALFSGVESGTFRQDVDSRVLRSRRVRINPQVFARTTATSTQAAELMTLNLFDDTVYRAAFRSSDVSRPTGGITWVGDIAEDVYGQVVLTLTKGILAGTVSLPGALYQIKYVGADVHEVVQIDPASFPSEAAPIAPSLDDWSASSDAVSPAADSGSVIDVLVVYTPAARQAQGGTSAMEALIDLAVAETNTGYENSGIQQRLNLVHTAEVNYTESSFSTDLSRLRGTTDGYMDEVHDLRDAYCADEVVLIGNRTDYCGIGYLMTYVSTSFNSNAFVVVARICATGYYSFAHELGHNMGAHHDRANASSQGAYAYAYGYQSQTEAFRTVMAYNCPGGCTRVPYWSNPEVTYGGEAMGVAAGEANAADNRLTLNNTAYTVANFRASCDPCPVPDSASPVSPSGETSETRPTFTWLEAEGSESYFLSVQQDGGGEVLSEEHPATVCSSGTCTVAITQSLPSGAYNWTVQGDNSCGQGPESEPISFEVTDGGGNPVSRLKLVTALLSLLLEE